MKIDGIILKEIVDFIQQINYGEVVITTHDLKVAQIREKGEKRFQ